MALVAGVQAPQDRVMGHAGAFVGAGERNAISKVRALEDAGVVITNHPSKFGNGMKELLANQIHRTHFVRGSCQMERLIADCYLLVIAADFSSPGKANTYSAETACPCSFHS